jgi:hypothetical protein
MLGISSAEHSQRDILRTKGQCVAVYSQHQPCHDPGGPSHICPGKNDSRNWANPNEGCKWLKMRAPRLEGPNQCPEFTGRRTNLLCRLVLGHHPSKPALEKAGYDIATAAIGSAAIKFVAKEGQRVNDSLIAPDIRGDVR